MRMHETAAGVSLFYTVTGPETGPAVVFSNSLGTDMRIWDEVVAHLPEGLRIIRYDARGHGLSSVPEGPYFMGDLVADVASLLDALSVRESLFVGVSLGGMIAQGLAAERPELVRAMVLSHTGAKIGTHASWHDRIHAVEEGGIEALADATMSRWFAKATHAERPDHVAAMRNMLTRTPQEGYIASMHAISETDLFDSTARLRLPTLGIAGSEDGSTPPDMVREVTDLVPGSRFELLRGTGHLACTEKPADYAALLSGFISATGHL